MDSNNVYERIKKRDYLGAFILTLFIGIGAVWGMLGYMNYQNTENLEEAKKELAALHIFYQDKLDKQQIKYQLVLDREREQHLKQLGLVNNKVQDMSTESETNGKLAKINAVKTRRITNSLKTAK